MTLADIFILIIVIALLGLIIYFSLIRPKIKHQDGCSKCPWAKQCPMLNQKRQPEDKDCFAQNHKIDCAKINKKANTENGIVSNKERLKKKKEQK